MNWGIERFRETDANQLVSILHRNFLEVNSRDYTPEEIRRLVGIHTARRICYIARHSHMYVARCAEGLLGCGALTCLWDRPDTSILLSVYVRPDLHGHGIGRSLFARLEQDRYYVETERTEVDASLTACGFYEKMGYVYPGGKKEMDPDGLVRMVKEHV